MGRWWRVAASTRLSAQESLTRPALVGSKSGKRAEGEARSGSGASPSKGASPKRGARNGTWAELSGSPGVKGHKGQTRGGVRQWQALRQVPRERGRGRT